MRTGFKHKSRGYSLVEMLVVLAIIGVLSLISVPAFMNFRRSSDFKSGLRNFMTDMRNARAAAIANSYDVRVEIDTGSVTLKQYKFYWSNDAGTTWNDLTLPGTHGATVGTAGNIKQFAFSVWVESTTGLVDYGAPSAGGKLLGANGKPDIVFHPNGSIDLTAGSTSATILLQTDWKKIAFDRYTITIAPSGNMTSVGSHS